MNVGSAHISITSSSAPASSTTDSSNRLSVNRDVSHVDSLDKRRAPKIRSHVWSFQKHMKKLITAPNLQAKINGKLLIIVELNEIETVIYCGGPSIDTFMMDHSYYLEELLSYCGLDVPFELRLRGLRLVSVIAHSSKVLRDLAKKKGAIFIMNELLCSKESTDEMLKWVVYTLKFLAIKDEGLAPIQSQESQKILLNLAKKDWEGWGNNEAEEVLRLCAKKLDQLRLDDD